MSICSSISSQNVTSRQAPSCASGSSFSAVLCVFYYLSAGSDNGGAICISATGAASALSQDFFFSCSAYDGAGACITSSQLTSATKCCFYNCTATYRGQSLYSDCQSAGSHVINSSTIYKCSPSPVSSNDVVIVFMYGSATYQLLNISKCSLSDSTIFWISSTSPSNGQMNTVLSNLASISVNCGSSTNGIFGFSNIFNNSYNAERYGLIYDPSCSNFTIQSCIIVSNKSPCLQTSGLTTIASCTFFNNSFTSDTKSVCPTSIAQSLFNSFACKWESSNMFSAPLPSNPSPTIFLNAFTFSILLCSYRSD